jgi:hypothetical protein
MAKKIKLSESEERVLRYLYEHKDEGEDIALDKIAAGVGLSGEEAKAALHRLRELGYVGGGSDLLADTMAALKGIDPKLEPTARGFSEYIILLASAIAGADETFLAKELAYDREFVGLVGSRLRNAGIWKGDDVAPLHLERWKESDISFFLDGSVAIGDLMVVGGFDDDPQYQMTPGGRVQVEAMLRSPR